MQLQNRVEQAILSTKSVCLEPLWTSWAEAWLSGKDRSWGSAQKAIESTKSWAAACAANAAAWAAAASEDASRAMAQLALNAATWAEQAVERVRDTAQS